MLSSNSEQMNEQEESESEDDDIEPAIEVRQTSRRLSNQQLKCARLVADKNASGGESRNLAI